MKINSKEIRKIVDTALRRGWTIHKYTSNRHIILKNGNKLVTVSNKVSCRHTIKNITRDLGIK